MGIGRAYNGRGKKAPYTSRTIRVPDPIRPLIEQILEDFYKDQRELIRDSKE